DCINSYSRLDTFTLCPRCACPLDLHHPRSAQVFNNLAQHINEFKLLLVEYEQALRNGGASAVATIAQTQKLFEVHAGIDEDLDDQAARNEAINDFISTQRVCDPIPEEGNERSRESSYSEELNDTPPPKLKSNANIGANAKPAVEFADCFDDFSDEEITATTPKANAISDSIPVLGEPIMTSTQRPTLFLSQAVHARSDLFGREPTQDKAPWLDLPTKKRSGSKEVKQWEHGSSTSTMHDDDSVASKSSRKGPPVSRSRRSSCSTPRAHSRCSENPILTAVMNGNIEEVRSAIDAGYDVNQRDELKRTPLFIAVEMKRLDICQLLVEHGGAVINANCGSECNTALHVAVSQENEEIVKYLLSKGASKTIRNIRQETPSQLAQRRSPLRSLVEKYRTHPRQPYVARLPDVYIVCYSKEIRKSLTYGEQAILSKLITIPSKFHRCPKEYNMVSAQWVIECVMEYAIKSVG
ncbi:ankyrin repeat protein, partial [Ostertagia ostertagi]